jgi:flagella basal body P-ring formation protein FlgA
MMTALVLAALVILPTRIEVAEGRITAADLIGESAVTLGDVQRMREVGLGQAPAAGQMRRIGGPYLRRLLRAAKVQGVRVPAQIELVGRADVITAEQQLQAITSYLKKRLGNNGEINSVRAFQNVTEFKVPPGSRITSVLPVSQNPFTARSAFKLEIRRRGQLVMRRYPQVTIQGKAQVRVARQTISARRKITASDFTLETMELSRVPARALGRFQISGMLASRRIATGRVVTRNDMKAPPVVHRGQRVRIELRHDSVSVSTAGEALADAAVGQRVSVRNLSSGRRLQGWVRGPGLVEVTP